MESIGHEPRFGLRRLAAGRGLSVAILLTLTLGLGAVTTAFTVVDTALLRELPFRDPGRLVQIQSAYKGMPFPLSQMDFADWRRQNTVFSGASVFGSLAFNLERGPQSRRLWGELVDDGYFPLLGIEPALGRFFTPEEDAKPFEHYVVVLGYDLWRSTFRGDPGVVGRPLRLNGGLYRVVGVGPQGFRGLSDQADLWIPSMIPPLRDFLVVRRERWIHAGVARLKPGVTVRQAQEQMNRITASLAERSPNMNQGIGATVTPLKEAWVGPLRKGVVTLTLAALLLLLFACFDASLLLSRATEPEARRSPVRQLSVQGVLLSLLAAVLGLLLARWATRALLAVSGVGLPSFFHFAVGPSVLAAIVGLAVLSGLALGPASAPRGPRARRWRGAVVLLQVALALFLLIDTGMVARNFRRTIDRDLGLRAAGVLTFRMDLKGPQYMDNERVSKLLRERYLPRIAAVPGVRQVALSNPTMPTDALSGGYITIEDHASDSPDGTYIILWHSVSPGYFETLGIPILAGRGFNLGDTGSDAVVVSRAMADQHWPRQNPLGKRIKQDARGVTTEPWMTVVGVVGEVHHEGFRSQQPPAPDIYMSVLQFPLRLPLTINFLVRPEPGISAVALQAALHREMMRIDPEVPDYDVATLEERLARQTEKGRFEVLLTGIFAGLSLLLAGVGLFGIRGERSAGPVSRLAPRPLGIGER